MYLTFCKIWQDCRGGGETKIFLEEIIANCYYLFLDKAGAKIKIASSSSANVLHSEFCLLEPKNINNLNNLKKLFCTEALWSMDNVSLLCKSFVSVLLVTFLTLTGCKILLLALMNQLFTWSKDKPVWAERVCFSSSLG